MNKNNFLKNLDFLFVDLFSLILSFCIAYRLHFGELNFYVFDFWVGLLVFLLFLDIIITFIFRPYDGIFRRSYYQEIVRSLQLAAYNFIFASIIFYLLKIGWAYSRLTVGYTYVLYFFTSLLFKYVLKKRIVRRQNKSTSPIFIFACRDNIAEVIENINAGEFKLYDILGVHITDDPLREKPVGGIPVINDRFTEYITGKNISEVLFAIPTESLDVGLWKKLVDNGISVFFDIDAITGFHPEYETIQNFGIIRGFGIGNFSFSPRQYYYLAFKRIPDILFSLIGCVFLFPAYLGIKIACLINGDRERILYTQKRIGLEGKTIQIYKFRSMVPDADKKLKKILSNEEYRREWEENQKLADDPRITKVGRFLRKTSIDELPQVLNVLKGEMSIVGPRPLVEGELEQHNGLMLYRKVKPGITGWWACNGRSNISYQERLELEYYYVKHVSFNLDFLCIVRTIFAVLRRDGSQ